MLPAGRLRPLHVQSDEDLDPPGLQGPQVGCSLAYRCQAPLQQRPPFLGGAIPLPADIHLPCGSATASLSSYARKGVYVHKKMIHGRSWEESLEPLTHMCIHRRTDRRGVKDSGSHMPRHHIQDRVQMQVDAAMPRKQTRRKRVCTAQCRLEKILERLKSHAGTDCGSVAARLQRGTRKPLALRGKCRIFTGVPC